MYCFNNAERISGEGLNTESAATCFTGKTWSKSAITLNIGRHINNVKTLAADTKDFGDNEGVDSVSLSLVDKKSA